MSNGGRVLGKASQASIDGGEESGSPGEEEVLLARQHPWGVWGELLPSQAVNECTWRFVMKGLTGENWSEGGEGACMSQRNLSPFISFCCCLPTWTPVISQVITARAGPANGLFLGRQIYSRAPSKWVWAQTSKPEAFAMGFWFVCL